MGHARKERVLLFGTAQQITSGPAAKRPHSNALGEDVELRIRATLAEAGLADLRSSLDDMREQRDHWQTMAQRLVIHGSAANRKVPERGAV